MKQEFPTKNVASAIVAAMTGEKVISSVRMTTGDQYFVFATKTIDSEYVIRLTNVSQKSKFISAIYWQEKLLPLGIPLAKFIKIDLDGVYSQFPALLMHRLSGDDLINVYQNLSNTQKRNLANQIATIQTAVSKLPEGKGLELQIIMITSLKTNLGMIF